MLPDGSGCKVGKAVGTTVGASVGFGALVGGAGCSVGALLVGAGTGVIGRAATADPPQAVSTAATVPRQIIVIDRLTIDFIRLIILR
jgi:hypothetical protein